MIRPITIAAALAVAGCSEMPESTPSAGVLLDAGTTTAGLQLGFQEANPILAPCGPAAGLCALVLKEGAVEYIPKVTPASEEEVRLSVDMTSWGAGCTNAVLISGLAAGPAAALVGGSCLVGYLASEGVIPEHERGE